MNRLALRFPILAAVFILAPLGACTGQLVPPPGGTGGVPVGAGGTAVGGTVGSGGASSGGTVSSGGSASGGSASGGAASGGAASGGTGAGGDWRDENFDVIPIGPTFQYIRRITATWTPLTCTGADCHGGTEAQISLIPDAGFYERLTTAVSNDVCLDTNGMPMKLIVPGEPENSALLRILRGPCENHGRMPDGCDSDCLEAMYTDPIEQWILEGALNN